MSHEDLVLWQKAVIAARAFAFKTWDRDLQTFCETWWWELESYVETLR